MRRRHCPSRNTNQRSRWGVFNITCRDFIFPLTLTIIAVLFPLWWQSVEQGKYNDQLIIGLKIELSQNWATINNTRQVLEDSLQLLEKEGLVDTRPLLDFRFGAWQRAISGPGDFLGQLGRKNTAGYLKLQYCYSVLRILQEKIDNRESYRHLQEGQPWFAERMRQLDEEIVSKLDKAKKLIETAQEFLYQIHDWKVAGESFSVDVGLVATESKGHTVPQQTPVSYEQIHRHSNSCRSGR